MTFRLSRSCTIDGYRIDPHDSVGSTNAVALDHARAGDPGRLWVVAREQQDGRGRRGRAWATPAGNLAATLLMVGAYELRVAATFGFVAGLALSDALDAAVPGHSIAIAADGGGDRQRFQLKWPNDVLADGAKLAGILLESTILPPGRVAVAIGIGVNVAAHPSGLAYPATSLSQLGSACDAETLFVALSDAWSRNVADWDNGRGLDNIRMRWLERAAGLGGDVSVRADGDVVRGVFETIDEECRFVIRRDDGDLVKIAAGDVHFGAVASSGAA